MTSAEWSRIKEAFEASHALPESEREAYAAQVFEGSPELRRELESLLDVYGRDRDFLEDNALQPPDALIGQQIGRCEVIRLVGQGGMSSVYEAVRSDGEFRQRVAIKVLKRGMDTDSLLLRFRAEREILAGFSHPNIARLLDGGALPDGRPFLTMEFIDGKPLTEYCDEPKLPIARRLDLFLQVCSGVEAAHRSLIVHRDIKPANILVTAQAECKLLDFGIAKILEPQTFPRTIAATAVAERLLTPGYASPEQVRGEPVTTASDIYSLGVVLDEILSGAPPRVRRGDLDNIVLKAMRPEPDRRYHSVEQLAEDICRYLGGRPVTARKETLGYLTAKFITRNKALSAALALLLIAVTLGMAAVVWQARRAEQERVRAERRFQEIRRIAGSVIFEMNDAIAGLDGATAARELLLRRATEMLDALAKDTANDAAFDLELASAYSRLGEVQGHPMGNNLGNRAAALASYRKAVRLGQAAVAISPNNLAAQIALGISYQNLSSVADPSEAESAIKEAIRIHASVLRQAPANHDARGDLGLDYQRRGALRADRKDYDGALADQLQSRALIRQAAESPASTRSDKAQLAFTQKRIGALLIRLNRLDEALKEYLEALALEDQLSAGAQYDAINEYNKTFAYDDIGLIYKMRRDFPNAVKYYSRALAIREAQSLKDPKNVRAQQGRALTASYLADVYREMGDRKQALEVSRHELAVARHRTL